MSLRIKWSFSSANVTQKDERLGGDTSVRGGGGVPAGGRAIKLHLFGSFFILTFSLVSFF